MTIRDMFRPAPRVILAPALALLLAPAAPGRASAQEGDLPPAEQVMNAYIEATGGREAYETLESRKSTGSVEITGAGITGSILFYEQAPNKLAAIIDLDQIGETIRGTNGEEAWEVSPVTGARLLDGEEKADFLREATFNSELKWDELYDPEVVGTEDVGGTTCYKVEMNPVSGSATTNYYGVDSGLLVRTDTVARTPMGEFSVETTLSDYREVDGINTPFKIESDLPELGVRQIFAIDSMEHNVEIPEGTFEVPDSVDL